MNDEAPHISYRIAGCLFFAVLAFLSVYYWQERMLFSHAANSSFHLLNQESFHINYGRFGVIFSQLIPLLFVKLNFSLQAVLISYSLSFVLLYFGIFLLLTRWMKSYSAAMLLIFLLVLGSKQLFYHPTSEVTQSLAFATLFVGWLYHNQKINLHRSRLERTAIGLLFIVLSIWTHPSVLPVLIFMLIHHAIHFRNYLKWPTYVYAIGILVAFSLKLLVTSDFIIGEDHFRALYTLDEFFYVIPNLKGLGFYFQRIDDLYFVSFSILVFTLLGLILRAHKKELLLFTSYLVLYFLGVGYLFPDSSSHMQMEEIYQPLNTVILIPFIFIVLKPTRPTYLLKLGLYLVLFVASIEKIDFTHKKFHRRIGYIETKLSMLNAPKTIISSTNLDLGTLKETWALSQETLILSSLREELPVRTVFIKETNTTDEIQKATKETFLYRDFQHNIHKVKLNRKYFTLPDTTNYSAY